MNKPMFNENESYNKEAGELSEKASEAVKALINEYKNEYVIRDIKTIIQDALDRECTFISARKSMDYRKEEKD